MREEPPRRRSRRGPLLLFLALLLAVGLGVGAWWFGWARWTQTPSVLGLREAAATERLGSAGLDVREGEPAYSETVPAGKVLTTDPAAGERVLDGGTVTVVLSLGKERYDVPKLRGKSEDQAQDALADHNLDFGESVGVWSEEVPKGTVLGSDPPVGTTLRPGTPVDLRVSKGPKPITIRDWTGQDADRAEQTMEDKGLVVDRGAEYSDDVPEGRVISQTPTSGTLFRGQTVEIVVSRGPELVEVPGGLVASGVDVATAQLEELGFEVEVVRGGPGYIGLEYVFSVDPGSGTMVPRGSTITLTLV